MVFDVEKITFQEFKNNLETIEKEFMSTYNTSQKPVKEKNPEVLQKIDNIVKYFGFIVNVSNCISKDINTIESSKDRIKYNNISNINMTTIYLIQDAITLMYNFSVFGINGIIRMIFENSFVALALQYASIEVNQKFFDWQIYDRNKYMNKLNDIPAFREGNEEFQLNFQNSKLEKEHLMKKYQLKKSHDYDWANAYVNKKVDEKVNFNDILEKVWTNPDLSTDPNILRVYYAEFSNYIHSTSLVIHNEKLNEIIEGQRQIMDIYSKLILIISMSLDITFSGYYYIIKTLNLFDNIDVLLLINIKYRMELAKINKEGNV